MRTITVYPYGGRNYICGDTVTFEDVQSLLDTFAHARETGDLIAQANTREHNTGNVQSIGVQASRIVQSHPVGISPSFTFWTLANWRNWYPFEINPNFNAFTIEATIRLLDETEYNTINTSLSGNGWRGQYIEIFAGNADNLQIQRLVTVYRDPVWYAANIGALTSPNVAYDSLVGDGCKLLSLVVGMTGNILEAGRANPAYLYALVKFPRNVDGSLWGSTTTESSAFLPSVLNPATGYTVQGAGIIDFQAHQFYLPTHSVTPTGSNGSSFRLVDTFSSAARPSMGDVLNTALWGRVRNDYRAARSIGFVEFVGCGRNTGGVQMPLVGDRGIIVNEGALQQATCYIEIPANAKKAIVVAMVRCNAQGGMTQALTVVLQKDMAIGITNQDILNVNSSNTSARIVYQVTTLGGIAPLDATSKTERATLILRSQKTNPRAGTVGNPANVNDPQYLYWDGIAALWVKFV